MLGIGEGIAITAICATLCVGILRMKGGDKFNREICDIRHHNTDVRLEEILNEIRNLRQLDKKIETLIAAHEQCQRERETERIRILPFRGAPSGGNVGGV